MGAVGSILARPFRNFNVDNRAVKVLERRQRVAEPAPYHPSTTEKLSRFRQEHPEFLEAQKQRDEKLHDNLKKVYVESTGNLVEPKVSTKPYPLNRKPPPDTDMGALEQTSIVPEGRTSLKTVFAFLGQHRLDPQNFTAANIAKEHKLDEKDVENVLHYHKILHLHIPNKMYKENKNMTKIVAEQLKAASLNAATPYVLSDTKEGKEKPPSDLSHTKT